MTIAPARSLSRPNAKRSDEYNRAAQKGRERVERPSLDWRRKVHVLDPRLIVGCLLLAAASLTPAQAAEPTPESRFVGSPACAACHATEYAAWQGSQRRAAMQVADEKTVLGNFNSVRFSYAGITSTFSRRDGKFFVRSDGPDGKLHDYESATPSASSRCSNT